MKLYAGLETVLHRPTSCETLFETKGQRPVCVSKLMHGFARSVTYLLCYKPDYMRNHGKIVKLFVQLCAGHEFSRSDCIELTYL